MTGVQTCALPISDYSPEGFRWINANDKDNSVFSFIRISPDKKKHLLFVLNFTPVERMHHRIGVPIKGKYACRDIS